MKNFMKFANTLIVISVCAIIFSVILNLNNNATVVVKNGVFNANNISNNSSVVNLNGQWEFYWNSLVSKNGKIENTSNKQLVAVPSIWTKYKDKSNKNLSVYGYGVYRIIIKAQPGDNLALKLPQIGSSYNLWIDGKLKYSSGKVGKTYESQNPKWSTEVANFTVQKDSTEILIEVSNFHYFRAGLTTSIILGSQQAVQQVKYKGLFEDTFIFAALTFMAVFFLLLYVLHTHNKAYIYLALFAITMAFRPLLYGESYFNNMFPNIGFEFNTKIYIINFIALQLFFLYFYHQYRELVNKKVPYVIGWMVIILVLIGVILPVKFMIYPIIMLEAMIPVVTAICICLFYRAYRYRHEAVSTNVLSLLFLCFLAIIDVITNNRIIKINTYFTPIGMLIITFIQTFLQVCKFGESALLNEKLSYEIELKNIKLSYEQKKRNFAERVNNGLQSMVSTLELEELLTSMAENLYEIGKFSKIVLMLNLEDNISIIGSKFEASPVKCVKYKSIFKKKQIFNATVTKRLYTSDGSDKILITKPLYYKDELICIVKLVAKNSKEHINADDMQLLDIFCEQSILALVNAKSYKKTKELALYDELTKLYNRRYVMKLGLEEFYENEDFCVAMIDVDYFKTINDNYGHLVGDEVLKRISDICKASLPSNSIFGRYGGEEFIIFFKQRKIDEILILLENLRLKIEEAVYSYEGIENFKVTISTGLAAKKPSHIDLNNVIDAADKALYKAKKSGRNCIIM